MKTLPDGSRRSGPGRLPAPTRSRRARRRMPRSTEALEAGDPRGHPDRLRPRDSGQHLGARPDLRCHRRRRRRRRRAHDADRARLPGGAVAARSKSRRRSRPCPASPTRRSTSSGIRRGRRTGCPTPRSCNWGCGDAAPLEESRLRADGDEAPRHAARRAVGERARDRRGLRHPGRADGQGAAAAGAARPAHVAPGHARRLPPVACRRR